jgi:putative isomerase
MTVPSYLRTPAIPAKRAWNSWAADRYLEMTHLPLGVRVTPVLYAASTGKTSLVGPGSDIRLGRHTVDGSHIAASFTFAGTAIDWTWIKAGSFDLSGHWKTTHFGEWGLRFWITLALSQEDGALWRYDEARQIAHCTVGPRTVSIRAENAPLIITDHESVDDLRQQFETYGYWYRSQPIEAPFFALRFNLDEAPENRIAVTVTDGNPPFHIPMPDLPAPPSRGELLDAIEDVMGWNGLWDRVNHRPYITCSRNWDLKKFGGFGFWLNDAAINALLVSLFDLDQARENLSLVLSAATPQGNLPCIITGNDAWVDRTQSPIISFIIWQLYRMHGEKSLLSLSYDILARNNEWLRTKRDGNGNGILEFGSSDVGTGFYKGTKLAAKDESFMDNSPIHDEARWNPESRTLDAEDVGLNCLYSLDCEMLARIATALGRHDEAKAHAGRALEMRRKIAAHFWDGERQIFANRLWSGKFVKSLAPTSFYPLLCGAASREQTEALLRHLDDPKTFGGTYGLPSVSRDDPAAADNVYWRGRIWPILNWLVWSGLKRVGADGAATRLAAKGLDLFMKSWRERRLCPENYHAETGEGLDQPDTDPFYSWSALLPFIAHCEETGLSLWSRTGDAD